jgi:hypothetical protein
MTDDDLLFDLALALRRAAVETKNATVVAAELVTRRRPGNGLQ